MPIEEFLSEYDWSINLKTQDLKLPKWLNNDINNTISEFHKSLEALYSLRERLQKNVTAYQAKKPPKPMMLNQNRVQYGKDQHEELLQQKRSDFNKAMNDLKAKILADQKRLDKLMAETDIKTAVERFLRHAYARICKTTPDADQAFFVSCRDQSATILRKRLLADTSEKAAKFQKDIDDRQKVDDKKAEQMAEEKTEVMQEAEQIIGDSASLRGMKTSDIKLQVIAKELPFEEGVALDSVSDERINERYSGIIAYKRKAAVAQDARKPAPDTAPDPYSNAHAKSFERGMNK